MSVNKTKIEWCTHTWNFIHGCSVANCRYCYARKMAGRMSRMLNNEYRWLADLGRDPFEPMFSWSSWETGLAQLAKAAKRRIVFIGSMGDIGSKSFRINDHEQLTLFRVQQDFAEIAEQLGRHTFVLLSKAPERFLDMPRNVYIGTSVASMDAECRARVRRLLANDRIDPERRILSIEPLLDPCFDLKIKPNDFAGIIVGGLSQGDVPAQCLAPLDRIWEQCQRLEIPLFVKDNLRRQFSRAGDGGAWPTSTPWEVPR